MTVLLCALLLQADPSVDRLIAALSDDDVAVRDKAERELIRIGPPAAAALKTASERPHPTARPHLQKILAVLDWDLPRSVRMMLGPSLVEAASRPWNERLEFYESPAFATDPTVRAEIWARAFEREDEGRRDLAALAVKTPGVLAVMVRRALAGRDGMAAARRLRAAPELADAPWAEAHPEMAMHLVAAGLGDLATPAMTDRLLRSDATGVQAWRRAAKALDEGGLAWESMLLQRRCAALAPANLEGLRALDAKCRELKCGAPHVALLKWLCRPSLPEDVRREAAALQVEWDKQGALEAIDLSCCLRVRPIAGVSDTREREVGARAVYTFRVERGTARISAHDRVTGAWLWSHLLEPMPNTTYGALDRSRSVLPLDDGVVVACHVDSELGGSGTLGETARHTLFVRLDAEGRVRWSREYDLDPGARWDAFDDRCFVIRRQENTNQGRTFLVRLADGSILSSTRGPCPVPLSNGRQLIMGSREMQLVDPSTGAQVWKRATASGSGLPVASTRDALYVISDRLRRFDLATGKMIWDRAFDVDQSLRSVIASDDAVYVAVDEGSRSKVLRLDADKKERWATREMSMTDVDRRSTWDPHSRWSHMRWVNGVIFFRGRFIDAADGTVTDLTSLVEAPQGRDPHPVVVTATGVYVVRAESMDEVNPAPARIVPSKIVAMAARQEQDVAKVLRELAEEWDPLLRGAK